MRTARLKLNGAYYHVMNRCALQEFLFDEEERSEEHTSELRHKDIGLLRHEQPFSHFA